LINTLTSIDYRIEKSGSFIISLRQTGHLPGLLNLSLFLKIKPHCLHIEGIILRWDFSLLRVF